MTYFIKISSVGAGILVTLVVAFSYALFHGYFDHGQFEIKHSQWSSANQIAMVAERSDHEALGGLEYFVLIGNHLFNPAELRHAFYSNAVVFNAASNCVTLRWDGPNKLVISCNGSTLDKRHINAQRTQMSNVSVAYENIALR